MCCLFGLLDPRQQFSEKQKARMLHFLATASEVRGTDATGIAYNSRGKIRVYKRPVPGHKLRFHIPAGTIVVMGHARMTTQGNEERNYNNHPFQGRAGSNAFALAHNGVLHNDRFLRETKKLPRTNIETDSFVAVQLLQQQGALTFDSLKYMAEQVEGSFSFTVLDDRDDLYFVKGDNPLCIYYYPDSGLYLYASTEEILRKALARMPYQPGKPSQVKLECGEILKIDADGFQTRADFDTRNLHSRWYAPYSFLLEPPVRSRRVPLPSSPDQEYIRELKSVASFYGFSSGYVDALLEDGFTTDDVEEMLYCGTM